MDKSNSKQKIIMNIFMILLALFSFIIAINTYDMFQNQLQVDKINHQPHFIFQEELDEYRNFKWLIVSNDGFHINAIQFCYPITFFQIDFQKNNSKLSKTFAVSGYLDSALQWRGDITKNQLFVIGDYGAQPYQIDDFYLDYESKSHYETGSNRQLHETREQIENNDTLKNMSVKLYIKEYVFINYTDVYFEQQQQAYSFDELYYPKLTDEERIRVWNLFFGCVENGNIIDIDNFDMAYFLRSLNECEDYEEDSRLKCSLSNDILVTPYSTK